jgi:hypothetical protein
MIPCKSCKNFGCESCTKKCNFYKKKLEVETLILRDQILKLPTEKEKTAFILEVLKQEGLEPINL